MDLSSWLHSLFYCFCSLLLSLNFLTSTSASTAASCLPDQRSALLQLKESFSYSDLSSWLPGTDCCHDWEGVSCNESSGHVTALDLSNRNILATGLSRAIFNLTSLRSLNLANNDFWGNPIPDGFEKLSMLTHLNLSNTNFTGQIPIGIANLTNLITLDLSCASYDDVFFMWLQKPNLRTLISNLSNLRELHLDYVVVSENGTEWCGPLSDSVPLLRVLSMRYCNLSGPIVPSFSRLNSLIILDLSENRLNSPIPDFFSNFPLKDLHLSDCGITGLFPGKIFHLPTLTTLDISYNDRLIVIIPDAPLGSSLERLTLDGSQFSNGIPDSIGDLENLSLLSLFACNISGPMPSSIIKLVKLEYLYLSANSLSGSIPPTLSALSNLKELDLRFNEFTGPIPTSIFGLPSLRYLDLGYNKLTGTVIPEELPSISISPLIDLFLVFNQLNGTIPTTIYKFSNLETLRLSSNQLSGPIPTEIFGIANLHSLYLDSNNLNCTIELSLLRLLSNLTDFSISHNQIFIEDTLDEPFHLSFPKIRTLGLASCNLTRIPHLLRYLDDVEYVDLSKNYLHGVIPGWLWKKFIGNVFTDRGTTVLNLSRNFFIGVESIPQSSIDSAPFFYSIDLSFNKIKGALPLVSGGSFDYSNNEFSQIPSNYSLYMKGSFYLSLTSNKLSGEIPSSICEVPLNFLDLSNNNLSGIIPSCILGGSKLRILNLASNKFHSEISRNVSKSCELLVLNLSNNNLYGDLPRSLTRCKDLMVLEIGNNHITDSFPFWLWKFSNLQIVNLRANQLYGALEFPPRYAGNNSSMRIIDFSSNNLNGSLPPSLFKSLSSIVNFSLDELTTEKFVDELEYAFFGYNYETIIKIIDKGIEMVLGSHLASIMVEIDLSNNRFIGDIPKTMGQLLAIKALNLSHNAFTGNIPHDFKNLIQMESLDLSWNNLTGEIPEELTTLDALSELNLSFNHLVGKIPQSRHFLTIGNSSFEGNPGLCGEPLSNKCKTASQGNNSNSPSKRSAQKTTALIFLCLFIGLGFGSGFAATIVWQVIKTARK